MTPAQQIAWHRSEADRIEAEERARRPALAACPFCGCEDIREDEEEFCVRITCSKCYAQARSIEAWNMRVSARDVLRVVVPDPPAPQVAP